jgi:hypothetical protein
MLVHIRVALPDRPGALGRVAAALGSCGADIAAIAVLDQEAGRAVDDLHVRWPEGRGRDRLVAALSGVPGVQVLGVRPSRHLPGAHPDLDLIGQVARSPQRGLETLVDMAPSAFAADWAAAVAPDGHPLAASLTAPPDPAVHQLKAVRITAVAGPDGQAFALCPLGPDGLLVLTREDGLAFHRLELMRLARVVDLVRQLVARPGRRLLAPT